MVSGRREKWMAATGLVAIPIGFNRRPVLCWARFYSVSSWSGGVGCILSRFMAIERGLTQIHGDRIDLVRREDASMPWKERRWWGGRGGVRVADEIVMRILRGGGLWIWLGKSHGRRRVRGIFFVAVGRLQTSALIFFLQATVCAAAAWASCAPVPIFSQVGCGRQGRPCVPDAS